MSARVLLVMPTSTYRASAFLRASERLGLDVTLATDDPAGIFNCTSRSTC